MTFGQNETIVGCTPWLIKIVPIYLYMVLVDTLLILSIIHLEASINSIKHLIYLILLKKRTAMVSAIEAHDVGCPDLAADVDSTEWILNRVAMSFNIS